MANHYRRCKDCGADRNDGIHISKAGRCTKCGERRSIEYAAKARAELERLAGRAQLAPFPEKPALIRNVDLSEVRIVVDGEQLAP